MKGIIGITQKPGQAIIINRGKELMVSIVNQLLANLNLYLEKKITFSELYNWCTEKDKSIFISRKLIHLDCLIADSFIGTIKAYGSACGCVNDTLIKKMIKQLLSNDDLFVSEFIWLDGKKSVLFDEAKKHYEAYEKNGFVDFELVENLHKRIKRLDMKNVKNVILYNLTNLLSFLPYYEGGEINMSRAYIPKNADIDENDVANDIKKLILIYEGKKGVYVSVICKSGERIISIHA